MKDTITNQIEQLISINPVDLPDSIDNIKDDSLTFERNLEQVKAEQNAILEKSKDTAKRLMDSMLRTFVSQNFLERSQYVRAKLSINTANVTSIIKQIEVCENSIDLISSEIQLDSANDKLYAALSALQKTLLELIKTQQVLITAVEADYKNIGETIDECKVSEKEDDTVSGVKVSDNKQLLNLIQGAIKKAEPKE